MMVDVLNEDRQVVCHVSSQGGGNIYRHIDPDSDQ